MTMSPASTHNKDESTSLSSSEDEEGVIRLSPQRLADRSSLHADHVLSSKKVTKYNSNKTWHSYDHHLMSFMITYG